METSDTRPDVRVGVRTRDIGEKRLRYLRQLEVTDVFIDHADTEEEPDEFNDRVASDTVAVGPGTIPSVAEPTAARERIEDADLRLTGIHSLPYSLYGDIMFDRPGKEESLDDIVALVRNLGETGVPILGYQWNPRGLVPMRTEPTTVRGDAPATAFGYNGLDDLHELADGIDREYSEAEMWDNYREFLETMLPVAEEAGVSLALHPVDPPGIESLGGIPQLFRNVENFDRAM